MRLTPRITPRIKRRRGYCISALGFFIVILEPGLSLREYHVMEHCNKEDEWHQDLDENQAGQNERRPENATPIEPGLPPVPLSPHPVQTC